MFLNEELKASGTTLERFKQQLFSLQFPTLTKQTEK